jgi:protein-tyrosine phosphatase
MKKVLFLCSGNYYRSRFAEILFNWHAQHHGLSWKADSRGLALEKSNPGPMSRHTMARLKELGIAYDRYLRLPIKVRAEDFELADHVVAVKKTEHRPMIERDFPSVLEQVEFWEVHDLDCVGPEVAIPHLEREVADLLERLRQEANRAP